MPLKPLFRVVAISALLQGIHVSTAIACDCAAGQRTPCAAFGQAAAVFVGLVQSLDAGVTELSVVEPFSGVSGATITLGTKGPPNIRELFRGNGRERPGSRAEGSELRCRTFRCPSLLAS